MVVSATGKQVQRGQIPDRAPEIRFEELEFHEKIGKGCFGSVFKGKCRGISVAIKVYVFFFFLFIPLLFYIIFFFSN